MGRGAGMNSRRWMGARVYADEGERRWERQAGSQRLQLSDVVLEAIWWYSAHRAQSCRRSDGGLMWAKDAFGGRRTRVSCGR